MKQLICNKCGEILGNDKEVIKKDFLQIKKQWGYFSKKDGEIHEFCLCEKCYDKIVKDFKVQIYINDSTELI